MNIGKPRGDNVIEFHAKCARECMPTGARKTKKANKSRLWKMKPSRNTRPVSFNMGGQCYGNLEDVMGLGLKIAREALEKGDKEYAERVVARIRKIPFEYERERLIRMIG